MRAAWIVKAIAGVEVAPRVQRGWLGGGQGLGVRISKIGKISKFCKIANRFGNFANPNTAARGACGGARGPRRGRPGALAGRGAARPPLARFRGRHCIAPTRFDNSVKLFLYNM